MIVLGIDPSLCATGIAAVELGPERDMVREALVVRTAPTPRKLRRLVADDNARRVGEIAAALEAAIQRHHPRLLVVESPPGGVKSALAARALGLAFGAVVAVATVHGLPLVQVQPLDVKQAATGRKTADKDDVIGAMEVRFPEVAWPSPASVIEHAADALAAVVAGYQSDAVKLLRAVARAA